MAPGHYSFRADWILNVDSASNDDRFLPVIMYEAWIVWKGPGQATTMGAIAVAGERLRDRLAAVFA